MSASGEETTPGWLGHAGRFGGLVLFLIIWLSPGPEGLNPAAQRLAAVAVLMAAYWTTQALPIAATSLLPLVLFPLLGIESARNVSQAYLSDSSFLYLGGFVVALGIERWGLHRRIALHVVARVGSGPRQLVLGFLTATFGLSMWISNTATTLLMLPIAMAMLAALETAAAEGRERDVGIDRRNFEHLAQSVLLATAYAASIGGFTTLVGTPTNIAFAEIWQRQFPDEPSFSAGQWILMWLPFGLIMMFVTWGLLCWNLKTPTGFERLGKDFFRERLRQLGTPTTGERWMMVMFGLLATLWVSRTGLTLGETPFIPGWNQWAAAWLESLGTDGKKLGDYINDSTVGMGIALLMFAIPVHRSPAGHVEWLMDWTTVQRLPWGILFLFGGGFAVAGAFETTGLATWTGSLVSSTWKDQSDGILVLSSAFMMTFLTEFTSNVATVNAILPILSGVAESLQVDPRMLLIPAAISASCGFMLPAGTPPNAIVFGSGRVRIGSMVSYGLVLNLLGVVLMAAYVLLVLVPVWGWGKEPPKPVLPDTPTVSRPAS